MTSVGLIAVASKWKVILAPVDTVSYVYDESGFESHLGSWCKPQMESQPSES
jgi:hypothetical protein